MNLGLTPTSTTISSGVIIMLLPHTKHSQTVLAPYVMLDIVYNTLRPQYKYVFFYDHSSNQIQFTNNAL